MALTITLVSVILLPEKASALEFPNINAQSPLKDTASKVVNLDFEIKTMSQKIQETEEVVQKVVEEKEKIESKKESLEAEVQLLQERVTKLDDMFVHINKYSYNSAGNRYAPGNCTWYVKSMRPDIDNFWGNANTWYANAKAQGWNVGSLPKKGAVATTTAGWAGHVAYVIGVSLDRQWVTIREMNYGGLFNMNTRTVHYSQFQYIYELD